jgi:1-phosphofructokinase
MTSGGSTARSGVVFVFEPAPLLTVTIEHLRGENDPEIHLHAGGQGVWIARMVAALGGQPLLVGPFGESGDVIASLLRREPFEVRATLMTGENGVYVHDRRSGNRARLAEVAQNR